MPACTIITGHYGSGKTEFCVNYALKLRRENPGGDTIYIADMDIINPYFRSREKADFLSGFNIEVIGNNLDNTTNQDVPAISGHVLRAVIAKSTLVVDLAGSQHGLKALSFFREYLTDYELWVVLNVFREECSTLRKMTNFIETAAQVSSLNVTGLVHNSHMLHDTGTEDVLAGQRLVNEVSEKTGVPVKYTFLKTDIYDRLKTEITSPVLTFDKLIMREEWL